MKEFHRDEPAGYCCGDTKTMLKAVIDEIKPERIAEIGSYKGMSAFYMCKNSDAHIYCIDTWKGSPEHQKQDNIQFLYDTFTDNMDEFKDRITPIRESSDKGLRTLHAMRIKPDMIFIDGDHSYTWVTHDVSLALDLFPEAVICGDDFSWESVASAVHDIAEHYKKGIQLFNERAWRLI